MAAFVYTPSELTPLLGPLQGEGKGYARTRNERRMDAPHIETIPVETAVNGIPEPMGDRGNTLMIALQQGDRTVLSELFALYNGRLFNFIVRMVRDTEAAEDIVQETWLSVYESRDRYETTYRFSTWLFTIARRKALSELRRRKVRSIVRSLKSGGPNEEGGMLEISQQTFRQPDAEASGTILSQLIAQALERVTPMQREIILLRDVEGMENEEVADVLGWNLKPGAIRKRVFDARAAFRREMEALGFTDHTVDDEE